MRGNAPSTSYSEQDYWEHRYLETSNPFEWYMGYEELAPLLKRHIPLDSKILQVGVGTSMMDYDMAKDGYNSILGLDFSEGAIAAMLVAHKQLPGVSYRVADCRDLSDWTSGSFDAVIDKGTLDSALCGDNANENARRMLAESFRVLVPGGLFMLITYGNPEFRLCHLLLAHLDWDVRFLALHKTGSNGKHGSLDFGDLIDPADSAAVRKVNGQKDCHFVYLCRKHKDSHSESKPMTAPLVDRTQVH